MRHKRVEAACKISARHSDSENIKKWVDELFEKLLISENSKTEEKEKENSKKDFAGNTDLESVEVNEDDFKEEEPENLKLMLAGELINQDTEHLYDEKLKTEKNSETNYEEKTEEVKAKLMVKADNEESGDFFDLREALKRDLETFENKEKSSGEEEFFLKEVLDKFKAAIDTQIDAEDYRTHYNLGIALMEMELFNEAIREFYYALKDPSLHNSGAKKFLDCCNLLGSCYIKIGLFNEAGSEIEKGLKRAGYEQRDYLTLKLLKGVVLENLNDYQGAIRLYVDILSVDPGNKEAKNRIRELQKIGVIKNY